MPSGADPGAALFERLEEIEAELPRQRRPWALWLLLLPIAAVLVPPLYSHDHPSVAGVPFFVWLILRNRRAFW